MRLVFVVVDRRNLGGRSLGGGGDETMQYGLRIRNYLVCFRGHGKRLCIKK